MWIVAHRRELVEQIKETVERYGISKEDGRVKVMSIQWLSFHWEDMNAYSGGYPFSISGDIRSLPS